MVANRPKGQHSKKSKANTNTHDHDHIKNPEPTQNKKTPNTRGLSVVQ